MDSDQTLRQLCSLDYDTFLKPSIQASCVDLSARMFFDWLESQVSATRSSIEDQTGEALQVIALEAEESVILHQYGIEDKTSLPNDSYSSISRYVPPSKLRQHASHVQIDMEFIQQESRQLRNRIAQKKAASDTLIQTTKILQRAIYDIDTQTENSEARLLDLSIKADTSVAASIRTVEEVSNILGRNKDYDGKDGIGMALSASIEQLDQIESAVRTVIEQLRAQGNNINSFYDNRSREAQICFLEAERLGQSLKVLSQSDNQKVIKHYWVAKELESLCQSLQDAVLKRLNEATQEAPNDPLPETELKDAADHPSSLVSLQAVDPEEFVRRSWTEDHLSILQHQEIMFDQSIKQLQELSTLFKPLHTCLENIAGHVQEAEAVLEAFGEEMEELELPSEPVTPVSNGQAQGVLETSLLQVMQGYRDDPSFDALDLRSCTMEDVLAELELLQKRLAGIQRQEKDWATEGVDALAISLTAPPTWTGLRIRPIREDLPNIYSNSTMNTTPPFAMNKKVSTLQIDIQNKVAKLHETTNELERELRENVSKSSHLKRLDAFVEQWT